MTLRTVEPADLPVVHKLVNAAPMNATWRLRGRFVPSYETERLVADAALTCIGYVGEHRPVGLYQVFEHQALDRHAQVSVLATAESRMLGYGVEGALLFIGTAFARFDLRKIYFLLSERSDGQVGRTLSRFTTEEGRMREHVLLAGTWQDVIVRAMWRRDYRRLASTGRYASTLPQLPEQHLTASSE